jgi:PAS domain S-box-containing protein
MTDQDNQEPRPRILFVEDEVIVRQHLAQQLASDYTVEAVGDGAEALRAILRTRPDLIVTDLVMPGLDGVELVKTLRETPSTSTIPILMVSGRAPDELRLEGFKVGADSFLAKPYTERELRVRIRSMLEAAQRHIAAARKEAQERAANEAVRERAALLESISDGFYAVDRDWRVTYVNQRALDYFSKSRAEFVGQVLWSAFPAAVGTQIEQEYRRVMRTLKAAAFETISPSTGKWIEARVYPTPHGIAVNFRDITDRKRAEAALRDSELRFRSMADAAPVLLWRSGPNNRGVWVNKQWLDFTGRTLEQELGIGWGESVHPEDRNRALITCEAALQKLAPLELEFRLRRHDGEYRWMLDRGMPVFDGEGGEFSGYIGTCTDITDRKLAEAALQKRGDEFFALADNIPILCWMAYADGRVYWFNRRWHEYTGTTPDSNARWGWESVHDLKVLPQVKERWHRSLATGEPFDMIFPLKGADGRFSSFLTRVVPIKDQSGAIVRWFGTNTDISSQLATEGQLRELTTMLEQRVAAAVTEREKAMEQLAQARKMETIGQLTGGVAHDFNNLLTPIVGALDMVLRKLKGDERAERLTAGALQAAESARTLIQRLLAFSRKQHLQARAVDISQLLANLSELLASTLGPSIERSIRVDGPLEPAHVDPNQLELALLNLCLNARDAMPDGGALAIAARCETVANHPRLKPGKYVSIAVADTGSGMDETTLQRAVEPFFTTKNPGQGTGLGLSMVHGLAAQSGGELVLSSAHGEGTTAALWLPISMGTPEHPTRGFGSAPNTAVEAGAILLVDDEDMVRQSTAAMLAEAGYQVVEANSGMAALALIEGGAKVNAVITDYTMPRMTGVRLAEMIRKQRPGMPILMITGYANLSDRDADGLPRIAKPFRATDITRTLGELLRHAGQGESPGA